MVDGDVNRFIGRVRVSVCVGRERVVHTNFPFL